MEKVWSLGHMFVTMFLSSFAGVLIMPGITDVTMSALCPGKDQCSLAIFLSGFQQAIMGLGMVLMVPLIGNLSDVYGRKTLLTLPMTLSVPPLVVLAYSRTTNFFYVYYVLKTLSTILGEGSGQCLAFAYVADNTSEGQRASAFGILAGVSSASFVFGTITARFLTTAQAFQVAAVVATVAVVYMRIFLKESPHKLNDLKQPILKDDEGAHQNDSASPRDKVRAFKKIPSVKDTISLLRSSVTFSQAACVTFFNTLGESGLQSASLYFLKSQFHFSKNQFADLMLIGGVAATVSQLVLMPMLSPFIGEEKLLSIGLFVGALSMIVNSTAFSIWLPYGLSVSSIFSVFTNPSLRSVVSKQVGPHEQGMAHGCISAISSVANIISPLMLSPLTALFLSDEPPFPFPGFSILCCGLVVMIAFIISLMIRVAPSKSSNRSNDTEP